MLTIYPTDTVWGLGAPVDSEEENRKVRQIKGNSPDKPLSVLFYDLSQLREFLTLPVGWEDDERLNTFFAKEGTLAIPRKGREAPWAEWIYGESSFATIRCLPLDFVKSAGRPFSTTSLNLQGEPPIVNREEAEAFARRLKHPHQLIRQDAFQPSGMASTILAILPSGKTEFWRQGRFYPEICQGLNY